MSAFIYRCTFAKDKWNPADWLTVKSPRWPHVGAWVQRDDCIENRVPAGASLEEMIGSRAGETYASMLYREPLAAFCVRAEMAFAQRMAPLIVLAAEPGRDQAGRREYREHVEVVLFDRGINVWHHFWSRDKGPHWKKAAHLDFAAEAGRRYALEVARQDATLQVYLDQRVLKVDLALPKRLYAGITGCEGLNRFYNFSLSQT